MTEEEKLSEFELQLIEHIIAQFKVSDEKQVDEKQVDEDVSKITYNDYYKNQGINYIKRNIKLNDPLLDPVFEAMAQNIKTPLEEWEERFPKRNEKKKLEVEIYESNYYL
jgi:hypothetical protein